MFLTERRAKLLTDESELGRTELGYTEKAFNKILNKELQFGNGEPSKAYMFAEDARAYLGQLKDRKYIYEIDSPTKQNTTRGDILSGADNVARILDSAGHIPEQLSKKTLQQLVGLAQKEERDLLEKKAKLLQTLTEHTTRRTVELQTKQQLPPGSRQRIPALNRFQQSAGLPFQTGRRVERIARERNVAGG